jgi:hypothetical protein
MPGFNVTQASTPEQKADEYNRLLKSGFTPEQIKQAATTQFGQQADADWQYLTTLAGTRATGQQNQTQNQTQNVTTNNNNAVTTNTVDTNNTVTTNNVDTTKTTTDTTQQPTNIQVPAFILNGTPEQKADYYNFLVSQNFTPAQIRQAVGEQTDANWNALTQLAQSRKTPVTQQPAQQSTITFPANIADMTAAQKRDVFQNLRKQFSDTAIRAEAEKLFGPQSDADWNALTGGTASEISAAGTPTTPIPQNVTAGQIAEQTGQIVGASGAPATATTATGTTAAGAEIVGAPAALTAEQIAATTTQTEAEKALKGVSAQTGTVGAEAQVTAAEMEPTTTQVGGITAAQTTAQKVTGAPTRSQETGELVSGPAVSMTEVENTLAKAEAAQGVVSEDMTVQGQLTKLMATFESGNPPPWAAGALRNATAQMAARGLSASSLAGQALVQAAMESALPVAIQDAQIFQQMEMQNLSNKQQKAMLLAQQRAAFLGQEFDQEFQTRVANAAKISDIANMNFNAGTQIALENARLAQTVDLANLNNRQAVVLAEAAQIANLEMANLNNRQQAAVVNAQAFLQVDMQNLANEQQTEMFKAQSIIQSVFTDAAAENAAKQFNAASKMQTDQFFASLDTQVKTFNVTQQNAMEQFNVSQENALEQFNAQQQNARDVFNAENTRVIAQSNAEWRRNIATVNTAAANQMAMFNAQNALQVTMQEYNNMWQGYRDDIEMAWKTADNSLERDNQIALQVISKEANIAAAKLQADALKYQALGGAAATILGKTTLGDILVKGGTNLVNKIIGTDGTVKWTEVGNTGTQFESDQGSLRIDEEGNYWLNDNMIWENPTPFED